MRKKLELCVHDVGTTSADAAGNYQFTALKPGWYAVYFLWSVSKKPGTARFTFKEGR